MIIRNIPKIEFPQGRPEKIPKKRSAFDILLDKKVRETGGTTYGVHKGKV